MTPDELPAYLESFEAKVSAAAPPVALGMAYVYQRAAQKMLTRYSHAPFTKTPSPPGQPPALMTGRLRASLTSTPGMHDAGTATAYVAPHTIYARIQEYGGDIYPRRRRYLRWYASGAGHPGFVPVGAGSNAGAAGRRAGIYPVFAKHVHLPARPYMRPAIDKVISDGSLHATARAIFAKQTGLG